MTYHLVAYSLSIVLLFCLQRQIELKYKKNKIVIYRMKSTKDMALVLLPLFIILAFRWDVGKDSLYGGSYWTAFHNAALGINGTGNQEFEIGFYYLLRLFSALKVPFFWFLFYLSVQFMFFVILGIQKGSVWPFWSVTTFFCLGVFFDAFSSLRQSFAEALTIFACGVFIKEANIKQAVKKYAIIILIAAQFHSTAYMYLILLFFSLKKISQRVLYYIIVLGVVSFPVLQIIFRALSSVFGGSKYSTVGFGATYTMVSLGVCFFSVFYYEDIIKIHPKGYCFVNLSVIMFLFMLNSGALILPYRIFDAIKIYYIFIIPFLMIAISKVEEQVDRIIVFCAVLFILFGWFFYGYRDSMYIRYQMVFEDFWKFSTLP